MAKSKAKGKPWSAAKFASCVRQVRAKGKVTDPNAVCAARMWGKTRARGGKRRRRR